MLGNNPNVNFKTVAAFLLLGLIRGSFALVLQVAVSVYKSPSLTFLLRTPLTALLYLFSVVFLSVRGDERVSTIKRQFKTCEALWRTIVMGFLQLALPYMCYMYALMYLPVTIAGCFMAISPWCTVLVDKIPCIKPSVSAHLGKYKIIAMITGLVGIVCVCASGLFYSYRAPCAYTESEHNNSLVNVTSNQTEETCHEKKTHIFTSFVALICGTLSWSVSSAFWRLSQGNVDYIVSGTLNNLYGGCFALLLWLSLSRFEDKDEISWLTVKGLVSISFLSVASGWLAAVMLYYLYHNLGPKLTNRVVCMIPLVALVEDHVFIRGDMEATKTWYFGVEVFGVLLTFIGLVVFSMDFKQVPLTLLEESLISSGLSHEVDVEAEARSRRYRVPPDPDSQEPHPYISFPPPVNNNTDAENCE